MKMPERPAGSSQAMGAALGTRHGENPFNSSPAVTLPRLTLAAGCRSHEGFHLQQGAMDFGGKCSGRTLWKNNKMLRELQNDGYMTSTKAHFFGKEFHNLKIIPQNRDFYAFLNFLASALSLKKLQESQTWLRKAEAKSSP